MRCQNDHLSVRQITNSQCSLYPHCTIYCLFVSSYASGIAWLRLSFLIHKTKLPHQQETSFSIKTNFFIQIEVFLLNHVLLNQYSYNYIKIHTRLPLLPNPSAIQHKFCSKRTILCSKLIKVIYVLIFYNFSVSDPQEQSEKFVY